MGLKSDMAFWIGPKRPRYSCFKRVDIYTDLAGCAYGPLGADFSNSLGQPLGSFAIFGIIGDQRLLDGRIARYFPF